MVTKELDLRVEIVAPPGGGADVINTMDEVSRDNIGRETYRFVRRIMRDPVMKAQIRKMVAEMQVAANG